MESIAQKAARGITVWAQDEKTGIEIGVNRSGELFLGNASSGYNLPDTDENRDYIVADFKRYTGKDAQRPDDHDNALLTAGIDLEPAPGSPVGNMDWDDYGGDDSDECDAYHQRDEMGE